MDDCGGGMKRYRMERFGREMVEGGGVLVYDGREMMLKIEEGYVDKRGFRKMVERIEEVE